MLQDPWLQRALVILLISLFRVLSMQMLSQRFTQGIDATEESMQSALESINARLNAPHQIKVS